MKLYVLKYDMEDRDSPSYLSDSSDEEYTSNEELSIKVTNFWSKQVNFNC